LRVNFISNKIQLGLLALRALIFKNITLPITAYTELDVISFTATISAGLGLYYLLSINYYRNLHLCGPVTLPTGERVILRATAIVAGHLSSWHIIACYSLFGEVLLEGVLVHFYA
jgi:hypothetical protein